MISSIRSSSNSNNNNNNSLVFPLRCYIHATSSISESLKYSSIVASIPVSVAICPVYLYARVYTRRTLFNVKLNHKINTLKYYVFFFKPEKRISVLFLFSCAPKVFFSYCNSFFFLL